MAFPNANRGNFVTRRETSIVTVSLRAMASPNVNRDNFVTRRETSIENLELGPEK